MNRKDIDWEEVYSSFVQRIFHFFCYKVGDVQLAEDLTAITFEKAWVSRQNFRKEMGEVAAWLMGIARHVAADHFRRPVREVFLEHEELTGTGSLDEHVQRQLEFKWIVNRLATYSSREQELVALKYGAELTNRQIAHLTGLSESNVGTILYRVIARLRSEMEYEHER